VQEAVHEAGGRMLCARALVAVNNQPVTVDRPAGGGEWTA